MDAYEIIIAGAGPCGLTLALELGRRGIGCLLLDSKPGVAVVPQANATQARTMEHFRRLGIADEIRAQGLPPDHPTDIAYFTRFAGAELARLPLPTARQSRAQVRQLAGSWSAAELPHRISQKFVEATLLRHVRSLSAVQCRFGWKLEHFAELSGEVDATIVPTTGGAPVRLRCRYLVGADGARSLVRRLLGIRFGGATGVRRDFMGGQMFAVHLRAPALQITLGHPPCWMRVAINPQRRAFMCAIDGEAEYVFHAAVRADEDPAAWGPDDARRIFSEAVGRPHPIEVLSMGTWTAGHSLVAERFQRGRVFLGGDAAHLFTPTGGLGYNTAVEDAVNLGWKLAAVLKGAAPPGLLDSYQSERRPLAERNTAYARHFADSVGHFKASALLEEASAAGTAARTAAGTYLNAHARLEFNIPGVTFGGRHDGSPLIVSDGTSPPSDSANVYVPTACPGGRPPHAWLADGRSLFDSFHFEWTLLTLGETPPDTTAFSDVAKDMGLDLAIVRHPSPSLRALYEAPLVLVRPDQIVAWRGSGAAAAFAVLGQASGRTAGGQSAMVTPRPLS